MTTIRATGFWLVALSRVGRMRTQLFTVTSVGCAGDSWGYLRRGQIHRRSASVMRHLNNGSGLRGDRSGDVVLSAARSGR